MTQDKDWKRLIRARMAKTGESYTSARAQLRGAALAKSPPGGRTAETAALARALAALGVTGAARPLSEALLFGIGGGIGIAYFVFEYKLTPTHKWTSLYLGGRINPYVQRAAGGARKDAEFLDVACARLDIPLEVRESSSPRVAETHLREVLAAGRPAIAMVDEATLGHGLPSYLAAMSPCPVGVVLDGAEPAIVDLDGRPRRISWAELARARASVKSAKHRLLVLDAPTDGLDLALAVRAGIEETCRGMVRPPLKNFGLPGLLKWAELVADERDNKGWPKLFHDSRRLAQALKWVAHWIVGPGGDGGFLRGLYADFLDEAAAIVRKPALAAVATRYRTLADEWAALAAALLPRSIPQLEPICSLLVFKRCLLERKGGDGGGAVQEIDAELAELESSLADKPISAADARALMHELRARLLRLHDGEARAIEALAAAV